MAKARAQQPLVNPQVVLRHPLGGEALLEPAAHFSAVECQEAADLANALINAMHDMAGEPWSMISGTEPGGKQGRRAARHRLDHHQAERLRPIDREQKRLRLAQEFGLAALIDLADELDPRIAQQRCDLFAEIGFIGLVDFGGDLQGNAKRRAIRMARSGRFSGEIRPRNATIAAARIVNGRDANSWECRDVRSPTKLALAIGRRWSLEIDTSGISLKPI